MSKKKPQPPIRRGQRPSTLGRERHNISVPGGGVWQRITEAANRDMGDDGKPSTSAWIVLACFEKMERDADTGAKGKGEQ